MKNILLALMTFIVTPLFAQNTEVNGIKSTKTPKHVNVPGTRLYIVPPTGFTNSGSFTGFQSGDNAMIQVMDMDGGNFYTNAATFSREKFEGKGLTVSDYKEFKLNEFPAKYVVMQKPGDAANNMNLVFGDKTFSAMLIVRYPAADEKMGDELRKALNTIYYDKETKVDPFATAAFILDDSKSTFKYANASAGLFIYAPGGSEAVSSGGEAFVLVNTIPTAAEKSAKQLSEMFVLGLEKKGFTAKSAGPTSAEKVNGYDAYESEINGTMNGKDCLLYQLLIKGKEKSVAIQGLINSDFDTQLPEIKKLARTVKLK